MWATFPMLREALEVIEAWGFTYKTVAFNWVKQNKTGAGLFWGLGNWTRSNSEICLLAVKGKPRRMSASVHSVIFSPVQQHSRKPAEARDRIVELMGDLPRIELFAREAAPGWDAWGDEAPAPDARKEETDFPDDGSTPIVCISAEAPISAAPELLAHELAHVATPEDKDHGEAWKAAEKAIGDKYDELLNVMIPDDDPGVLAPHEVGDGGLLLMPTRANIPDPQRDDWKPTTCPICGAECWETEIHRQALAAEPGLRAVCTDCGLRGADSIGLVDIKGRITKEETK